MAVLSRRSLNWIASLAGLSVALLVSTSFHVKAKYSHRIFPASVVPHAPVALVFGAGLAHNGVPSPLLAERLDSAVELYRIGKVEKVLLSGDDSFRTHDETRAMRRYAETQGVPEDAIVRDVAGLSTYDSCFRAKAVFGVRRAILVTQGFHLPRALFIANSLGIDADGVPADATLSGPLLYEGRELLSRALAWIMVMTGAKPKFLGDKALTERK